MRRLVRLLKALGLLVLAGVSGISAILGGAFLGIGWKLANQKGEAEDARLGFLAGSTLTAVSLVVLALLRLLVAGRLRTLVGAIPLVCWVFGALTLDRSKTELDSDQDQE